MALFSFVELVDAFVMVVMVAYIFSDIIPPSRLRGYGLSWDAVLAVAPGIVLHEFAHKIVALFLGFQAVFQASYVFLLIGALLKFVGSPFIFFVPGYVSFACPNGCSNGLPIALVAFSGPALNGILYLWARWYESKVKSRRAFIIVRATRKLNGFLFIFNMIPFPLFDGYKVFAGLWAWLSVVM